MSQTIIKGHIYEDVVNWASFGLLASFSLYKDDERPLTCLMP